MAVIRKFPAPSFKCRTFGWRYNNWYKQELEASRQTVEVVNESFQQASFSGTGWDEMRMLLSSKGQATS